MTLLSMRRAAALLFVLTAFVATGCDSNDVPSIGGTYVGTETSEGVTSTITLDIPDTEAGSFAYTGTISATGGGITLTVPVTGTGTFNAPNLTMTLVTTFEGETETAQLMGTASASGDSITLQDGEGVSVTLNRQ